MNNKALDFSKKIFLRESFKENNTSKQAFPFKIQYGNTVEYSFYEKAIFAAKETILRKVNYQIECNKSNDNAIDNLKYLKNILFGPNEIFTDALYNLAKAYVRACCIFASILDKSPEDFEKENPDLVENIAIDYIKFCDQKYDKLNMCLTFYYDSREKLEPSIYNEDTTEEVCKFGDYHAVKVASIYVKLAILDIYEEQFKRERKPKLLAKRGETTFEIRGFNEIDHRLFKMNEKRAIDLNTVVLPGRFELLQKRLINIYHRNDGLNDKSCSSCSKFSQKESNCGGADLSVEKFGNPCRLTEKDEELLNSKFFKATNEFTRKEDDFKTKFISLYIPEEIADHFVSTKYNWLEWAYLTVSSKLAKCDIASECCENQHNS